MKMMKLRNDLTGQFLNHHWQSTRNGKTWNSEAAFKSHLRLHFKLDRNNILRDKWLCTNDLLRTHCENKTVFVVSVDDFGAESKEIKLYDFLCDYIDSMTENHIKDHRNKIKNSPSSANYYQGQIDDLNKVRELFEHKPI